MASEPPQGREDKQEQIPLPDPGGEWRNTGVSHPPTLARPSEEEAKTGDTEDTDTLLHCMYLWCTVL